MEEGGFEPPNSERAVLQTAAFSHFATPPGWWRGTESNRRHKELQSFALPTELPSHSTVHIRFELMIFSVTGRRDKPLLQWTILREVDLNHRPSGYEPDELPYCSIPRCYKGGCGIWTHARQDRLTVFKTVPLSHLGNPPNVKIPINVGNDPYGIWTHVTAVKGRCLNHLTNGSYSLLTSQDA